MRAVQVATLLHREPAQNVLYQLRTERQITSITEPTGAAHWDHSPYFLLHFPNQPAEDTTLVLTIRYADGGTDHMTMRFRAPIDAQAPSGGDDRASDVQIPSAYWVSGPAMPSTSRSLAAWKSRTAASVRGP